MQRIMCDGGFLEIQNSLTKGNQFGSDSLGLSGLKPFDGSSHPTVLSDHRACRTGSHESLRKVTRVLLPLQSAHEAAGAAGIRHSPRPQRGGRFINASGASRREVVKLRLKLEPSLRGALATKQSILPLRGAMDCFASLAMTAQHLDCLWVFEIRKPSL